MKFSRTTKATATILACSLLSIGGLNAQPSSAAGSGTSLLAVGDMADCAGFASPADTPAQDVADLIGARSADVLMLGDLAYPDGSASDFNDCYDPIFGSYTSRAIPVVGNHEYHTRNGSNQPTGYINYFGTAKVGAADKLYYEKFIDDWQLLVLNTNNSCIYVDCDDGSLQLDWLEARLQAANAANPNQCRIIAMHHPRWTSYVPYSNLAYLDDIMDLAYQYGTDLVLTGHAHHYERFTPQNPDQVADPANGFQLMVLGTGGVPDRATGTPAPNSASIVHDFGVTEFDLRSDSYSWSFIDTNETVRDSGSRDCVNKASVVVTTTTTTTAPTTTSAFVPGPGENDEIGGGIFRLYKAVFQRNPDSSGFTYWHNLQTEGLSFQYIADYFAASVEFNNKYGSTTNEAFIDLVYQNTLGRPGEPGGRAYWIGVLNSGVKRGDVVTFFSDSPEFRRITPFGS